MTFLGAELVPKRVELLKEALPKIARIAAPDQMRQIGMLTGWAAGEDPEGQAHFKDVRTYGRVAGFEDSRLAGAKVVNRG